MHSVLTRPAEGRVVAGVCAGLARYLGLPTGWVRAGVVALTLLSGVGVVFYAWLWIFVPDEHEAVLTAGDPVRGAAEQVREAPVRLGGVLGQGWQVIFGVVLLGVAAVLALQLGAGIRMNWGLIGPVAVVLLGIALAWLQLDTLRDAGRAARTGRISSLALGLLLVMAGVLALAAGFVGTDELWLGLLVAGVIVAGVVLVAAPWVLKAWRDATAKTSALAVQTERAEIAAHLHDSVLQTLALIQKNADTPSTVVRLARAQERDLRQYLYQDPSRPTGTLTDRLEDLAAAIEDDHGQPIEVVTVGSATGPWLDPVLQASREAMLNGVRHAGPVQVYAEARPEAVEVFVKDRGPGFDLSAIPADRLGIRESVVGRMERAGGTARIITGDGGTEVRLHLPVPAQNGKNGEEGRQG
ncbi:ATP-binding protein [Citricoccus sp.]|uniref:ATP-binding protein n=1 Tax=Citricoccus sp. TaxID=1978372 RepID=UPI002606CC13|nr:ATP-binding protein [Citricoccus sp.]HRO29984.1 PspC domain-containing protein [Citricoccus sp.]HRO93248.1 PspC domain-containing protein [Citricoccus sp.]